MASAPPRTMKVAGALAVPYSPALSQIIIEPRQSVGDGISARRASPMAGTAPRQLSV
jgi:hypothetical protein